MKVAQPPVVPIPERKPEPAPPPAGAGGAGFRAVMAEVASPAAGRPGAARPDTSRSIAGQRMPPLPGIKPEPPFQLANGQAMPPTPGVKPDPLMVLLPQTPATSRIVEASQRVAGLSGHSFTAILAQATQESGLDATAKNKSSSAAGPFQFLERTWLGLIGRHGSAYGLGDLARQVESRNGMPVVKDPAARKQILELRHDPDVAAGMAARYLAEGRERLERSLKRPVTETESRIAYVMGVGGAAKLIKAAEAQPGAVAAEILPNAAKANHNLFHDRASGRALTAQETVARLVRRMETEQRDMFAAIARAAEPPTPLDGGASPLASFRTAAAPAEEGDGTVS
ncbi:lytic transglycosylase domain-containing protein [Azospirillum sp.]|uniref:lytic transglycosylase domain-containing protein n=1 Tax=Azospirillum sp. TaxID=34012 RepID=UPI002D66AF66|nr:lytic transglycosylase domain-containing protein [Azospirillum sp.]HYD68533.1 lytic transglycosylase domain-containing protein [Azospirillum sp.]